MEGGEKDREREKMIGERGRSFQKEGGQDKEGTDAYGSVANRSIPLIAQLAQADDMNAI